MSLPKTLQEAWDAAEAHPGTPIDIGRAVVCDSCDRDYTESREQGGMIVGSYGYGPCCAPRHKESLRQYGELHFIVAECPAGQSYADFIRAYRNRSPGGNTVSITPIGRTP